MKNNVIRFLCAMVGAGYFNILFDLGGIRGSRIFPSLIGVVLGEIVAELMCRFGWREITKTLAFVLAASGVAAIAWASRPTLPVLSTEGELPKVLFPAFDDPLKATSLEIVEFDESTATLRPFKVAQVDNEWSIPSHENYPADAENQLAEAAASLVGLKPLDMASDSPGDRQLYGVVEPDPHKLKPGDTGVGMRVEMRNKDDEVLLSLVIGKKVPDREELRYVRIPGKDPVYTVKLKTDKLSTKFEDWIEEDLLKLSTLDVRRVQINDYSVDILAGRRTPRSLMTLEYDDKDSKWKLIEDKAFQEGNYVDMHMADDEELNTSKLNDMKWELDDLKIVDVARKPEGLSDNLKDTGQVQADSEAFQSLANRGFYIVPVGDHYELLSSEGEISILMKDGVQYVLRFGQVTGSGAEESAGTEEEEGEKTEEEKTEEEKKEGGSGGGMNRYLFVMAEFNPDAIPKPELEPLPTNEEAPDAKSADETASEENATADKPAEEDAPKDEKADSDTDDKEADAEKERQRIEKENKRKQEEYDEKVKKGKEHVNELNQRFADWYYVIADSVYQKIHLSREDVIKKKEKKEDEDKEADKGGEDEADEAAAPPKEEGDGVSDFEALKQEGLEGSRE